MKYVVWGLVVALMILHQDVWFWEDKTLVLGFIPIGLFYHACISVGAGITWYLATIYAWPADLEQAANPVEGSQAPGGSENA